MDRDLMQARDILCAGGCTCVLCGDGTVYKSSLRGVAPLLELLDSGVDYSGFCAGDKVVGKAAAFLYCLLGVSAVYAPVISRAALGVLADHGIRVDYGVCAEAIFNRKGDGLCPMETATGDISDPHQALAAIRKTLAAL